MEEQGKLHKQKQLPEYEGVVMHIGNEPVMKSAADVLTVLGKKNKTILRSRGNSIPNAVAVANIITEDIFRGSSKVERIVLDTESAAGIGKMTSTIEIVLNRT